MYPRDRHRDPRRDFTELIRTVGRPRRANPILLLYRWRYELVAAASVPTALLELDHAVGPLWSLLLLFALTSAVAHWPAARRFAQARLRGVLIQHRLRTAFARARICTLDGKLPAIWWTSPRGELITVWVSCPAGVDATMLDAHRETLAAACFATEVTVARHERRANWVALTVRTEPAGS